MKISILIPAFNEGKAIHEVVSDIKSNFPDCEIIVINDGSTDNTSKIAKKSGVTVIDHIKNYGYGASLKTGIKKAKGEYVLMCDADGQHRVEDIKKIIEESKNYNVVIGVRDRKSHVSFLRRPGKYILRKFADYLAGEKLPDFNSGLRLFKRDLILKYLHLMSDQFSFSTTSTFAMLKTNQAIKYVPIVVNKRIGKSSVSQIKHGTYTIMLILRLTVLFEPLKVFLHIVALFLLLGFISLSLDILHVGQFKVGTTTSLMFVSALIIFMFALLCDQVSAMRRDLNDKDVI